MAAAGTRGAPLGYARIDTCKHGDAAKVWNRGAGMQLTWCGGVCRADAASGLASHWNIAGLAIVIREPAIGTMVG